MAKVFGFREIELQPGVTGEEFERFFQEEIASRPSVFPGWKWYLMKGDRWGKRMHSGLSGRTSRHGIRSSCHPCSPLSQAPYRHY